MKTLFIVLFGIIVLIYSGRPIVNFQPFSISFERPYLPFATFFLVLAISFYTIQYEKIGYKKGVNDTIDVVKDVFKDKTE